ncbi:hypothetical protein [Vibrio cholerae]|uniref:Uncharacterized protein n=1 Tax=Vibrio cholerae TaxID=666 RepID=A0ABD7SP59_VIBCL|nr:hypothetical protein [Vibrio cholerae]TXX66569.1 hypothetical protein FXF03_06680 [Vibrio cholerae]GIA96378.1 hypothetical protein VCSRO136_1431 [Vibrio cholerae]
MDSKSASLFKDIPDIKFVDIRYMEEGRRIVLFKFDTDNTRKKRRLKEMINSLTGTMGGDNVYFGNAYGNEVMDFFFNIELKESRLVDELNYVRIILNRALELVENNSSLVSFTIEADERVKFATFSYLSYLPQYLQNLNMSVSFQSSMVDDLIQISLLQLSSCNNDELKSALSAFLLLPTMEDLQLESKSQELTELIEKISDYKCKLNQLIPNSNLTNTQEVQLVDEKPIELFGGYVKIPALDVYGIEINLPKIINKLNPRKNKNANKQFKSDS